MIDLGQIDNQSLKMAKWDVIPIANNEFVYNKPVGSAQVSQSELIIFGGQGNHTYAMDTLDVSHHQNQYASNHTPQ